MSSSPSWKQELTHFVFYYLFQESAVIFIVRWKFSLNWFLILLFFSRVFTLRSILYLLLGIFLLLIGFCYIFHLITAAKPEYFKQIIYNFKNLYLVEKVAKIWQCKLNINYIFRAASYLLLTIIFSGKMSSEF